MQFDAANWYWFVAGDTTRVFSSAIGNYVPVSNPTYQSWVAAGGFTNSIISEQDLYTYLVKNEIDPGVLGDSASVEVPAIPMWALKAALAAFAGGDKEAAYTTWITANKATRLNLFYQWAHATQIARNAALVGSIASNTNMSGADMSNVFRNARKRANNSGVV